MFQSGSTRLFQSQSQQLVPSQSQDQSQDQNFPDILGNKYISPKDFDISKLFLYDYKQGKNNYKYSEVGYVYQDNSSSVLRLGFDGNSNTYVRCSQARHELIGSLYSSRAPQSCLVFDENDQEHLEFLHCLSNIVTRVGSMINAPIALPFKQKGNKWLMYPKLIAKGSRILDAAVKASTDVSTNDKDQVILSRIYNDDEYIDFKLMEGRLIRPGLILSVTIGPAVPPKITVSLSSAYVLMNSLELALKPYKQDV